MIDADAPPFQFGIRHLLLTTAVVAVIVGICAPFMRDWNADQWWSVMPDGKPVPLLVKLRRYVIQLHPRPEQEREIAEYLLARSRTWNGPSRPSG